MLTLGAAVAAFSAAAADVDLSKLPPASTKKGVTYAADIEPIFKASCYNCHSAQRPRKNLRLDSLEAALKGSDDGKVITPGKSETSDLVIAVARINPKMMMPPAPRGRGGRGGPGGTNAPAGGGMAGGPPGGGPGGPGGGPGGPGGGRGGPPPKNLTPEEVGLVRAWIDQGAK
jgi:hypothetical protein